MKKILIAFMLFALSLNLISATCTLTPTLINQDPIHAVPGEYVTLIFQVEGVENPECRNVYFELIESYPISFDPGTSPSVTVVGGTFVKDYVSYLRVPYKVRIDANAVDGESKIDVRYGHSTAAPDFYFTKSFNLSVKDVRSDFEIYVKNYDPVTKRITFEILNTGENDVEALTLEVKNQDAITLRGPGTNIIGSLDSNDFTTADFEATAASGEIDLVMYYTDSINTRRTLEKTIYFDSQPFVDKSSENGGSWTTYIILLLIVAGIAYYFYRRHKKKKERHKLLHK
jgi:hypothetical protein